MLFCDKITKRILVLRNTCTMDSDRFLLPFGSLFVKVKALVCITVRTEFFKSVVYL